MLNCNKINTKNLQLIIPIIKEFFKESRVYIFFVLGNEGKKRANKSRTSIHFPAFSCIPDETA